MIKLIIGHIDQGKTSRMLALYQETKKGDGFICKKHYRNGRLPDYDVVWLKTGDAQPLAYDKQHLTEDWDERYCFGRFSFAEKGLVFAEQIIAEIIRNKTETIFIDEIGPLEIIEGRGFCDLFKQVLLLNREVFITVRSEFKDDLVRKFNIRDYQVIKV